MFDGLKTKLGGIGAMLTGLGMLTSHLATGVFSIHVLGQDALVSLGGLVALGLGGKLQKLIDALKK